MSLLSNFLPHFGPQPFQLIINGIHSDVFGNYCLGNIRRRRYRRKNIRSLGFGIVNVFWHMGPVLSLQQVNVFFDIVEQLYGSLVRVDVGQMTVVFGRWGLFAVSLREVWGLFLSWGVSLPDSLDFWTEHQSLLVFSFEWSYELGLLLGVEVRVLPVLLYFLGEEMRMSPVNFPFQQILFHDLLHSFLILGFAF